jgi:hypothetical protein
MAKRKRSPALFEVIGKSKQYRPAQPATARTGRFFSRAASWFSRPKLKPIVSTEQLQPGVAAQDMVETEAPAPSAQEASFAEPVTNELPEETNLNVSARVVVREEKPAAQEAGGQQRHKFLKSSYGITSIVAFGVLFVGGLLIMIGHHLTRTATPLLADVTTEELRKGPAHREVLELPQRGNVGPSLMVSEPKPTARQAAAIETQASSTGTPQPEGKRYMNFNYVMIQSYPEEEIEMAEKAAAFLNSHGVACTVEKGVKGFLKVSVVGLDGFTRISSPEFKSYVEHIKTLSAEFTRGTHSFKGFDPRAKKWDKPD